MWVSETIMIKNMPGFQCQDLSKRMFKSKSTIYCSVIEENFLTPASNTLKSHECL